MPVEPPVENAMLSPELPILLEPILLEPMGTPDGMTHFLLMYPKYLTVHCIS